MNESIVSSSASRRSRSSIGGVDLDMAAPWLFVLLWSTGFIGAKYGLPYAEPFTFLFVRWLIACGLLVALSLYLRSPFPRSPTEIARICLSGILLHAVYLGGVFFAIDRGMPAALSSLIVGLQPILTAVLAQLMLREDVTSRQWLGLLLGFAGVGLVVEEKVSAALDHPIQHAAFIAIAIGLVSTTLGTLYQKRFVSNVDLIAGATIQYATAPVVIGIAAASFETMHIDWTWKFVFALAWLVIVLSIGAVLLLLGLIRRHSVSRISSLMYLVPPLTAIEAHFIFGEQFGLIALAGMACVIAGVALVMRRSVPAVTPES